MAIVTAQVNITCYRAIIGDTAIVTAQANCKDAACYQAAVGHGCCIEAFADRGRAGDFAVGLIGYGAATQSNPAGAAAAGYYAGVGHIYRARQRANRGVEATTPAADYPAAVGHSQMSVLVVDRGIAGDFALGLIGYGAAIRGNPVGFAAADYPAGVGHIYRAPHI